MQSGEAASSEQMQAQHSVYTNGPVLNAEEQARLAAVSIFRSTLANSEHMPAAPRERELVSYDDL